MDFVSGAVDRGFASVCGRLRIHTWPWSSPVTADPNPILHFAGTFGQAGSFSNCGNPPSPICGACVEAAWPKAGGDTHGAIQAKRTAAKAKPNSTECFMGSSSKVRRMRKIQPLIVSHPTANNTEPK